MLEFWIFQRKRKMHSNEQNRIITKSYDSDVAFACNHSFWHWFSFFYEQVFVARCSVKIFIFYPWVVVAFGAFNNASFHAGFENACGEREHLSVFEYVHKTWWSKYMHFQIEFQLNNIAFACFPNLRISGVQKFWIPDTSRQWAMESYSSKCSAKTILFKLSLLNILFGVRLLFFARNPHYARAMNCKWCCTMQMLQIFNFDSNDFFPRNKRETNVNLVIESHNIIAFDQDFAGGVTLKFFEQKNILNSTCIHWTATSSASMELEFRRERKKSKCDIQFLLNHINSFFTYMLITCEG